MGNPIVKQLQFPNGETFDLPGGKSAYEIAQENGFSGTESQWLASLVGPKGDKGDKGDPTNPKTVYIGFDETYNYVCDGIADDIEFKEAIEYLKSIGGGYLYVGNGEYTFDCVVRLWSNIHIVCQENASFKACAQKTFPLESQTVINSNTIELSNEILSSLKEGQEIGFTNGSVGYLTTTDKGQHNFIMGINGNTVTVKYPFKNTYTTLVTLNSIFRADESFQGVLTDISIDGGKYDDNFDETTVWIADMCQNSLIFGGVIGLVLKNLSVVKSPFQGLHYTGEIDNKTMMGYLENVVAYDNHGTGICIDSIDDITIKNCRAYNNGNCGLQFVECGHCEVDGGQYYNNSFCGVRFTVYVENSRKSKGNHNIHNVLVSNNKYGLGMCGIYDSIISNNIFVGNENYGVGLEEHCKNVLISSCQFIDNNKGIYEGSEYVTNNKMSACSFNNNSIDMDTSSLSLLDMTEKDRKYINSLFTDGQTFNSDENYKCTINSSLGLIRYNGQVPNKLIKVSKNIFNYNMYLGHTDVYKGYRGIELTVKPNTLYTCSTEMKNGNTVYFGQNLDMGVEQNGGAYTAQSDANGHIYIWILSDRDYYEDYVNGVKWIQIEEGDKATDYEPYGSTSFDISRDGQIIDIGVKGVSIIESENLAPFTLTDSSVISHIADLENKILDLEVKLKSLAQ